MSPAISAAAELKSTVAPIDRFAPECDRQVRLAQHRRPEQQQGLPVARSAPVAQIPDLPRIDRGCASVRSLRAMRTYGEARELHTHLDAPCYCRAGRLTLGQEQQRFAQHHLCPAGFVEQAVELVADRRQVQPGEQSGSRWVDHHQPPQPVLRTLGQRAR